MKNWAFIVIIAVASGRLAAQERPTQRIQSCTASGCHTSTMEHNVLHGPVAVGACDVCHEYDSPQAHTFTLKHEGRNLCDFCHIDKVGTEGPVVHDPVAKGNCLDCHNPHGGTDHSLVRKATVAQQCAECHADTITGSHVHTPAAEGRCTDCHSPHTARHPGLLMFAGRDLCLHCHTETAEALGAHPNVHEPLLGDCLQCHTTHASDIPRQLLAAPRALCSSCHQEQEQMASTAAHPHSIVLTDRACLNCHAPHSSLGPALLPEKPAAACQGCHENPIKAPDGTTLVKGVPEVMQAGLFAHGPVKEHSCAECHAVHGAPETRLLTLPYTESFYQPFKLEAYALCFSCHESELATEAVTDTATAFRDGSRNLHFLHVNRENGRSCRACHTTHAGKNAARIADEVPFGQWKMPQTFTKTVSGGSCSPGCHRTESYDRLTPVGPGPAPSPAPVPGRTGSPPPPPR